MAPAATQARRKSPFARSTGIQAHAERQIRRIASALATASRGAATQHGALDKRAPEGGAQLQGRDRDGAQDEGGRREEHVMLLEGCRPGLRDAAGRQAGDAWRQRGQAGRRDHAAGQAGRSDHAAAQDGPDLDRLAVQHRHPFLVTLVFHGGSVVGAVSGQGRRRRGARAVGDALAAAPIRIR